ncbi:flagellar hook-length control protein FliK [Dickeya solani]|uniref:Flagellar hook-length control protein n=1 Tax=Dickeya solani D s0432-1 TaxID=1231725 RepID=A0AAV3K5R1_9GAMM|nr:flagellar hook-length control protein FliK [Dickeya solani]ANE74083.1 flagellar hook-length control protein [Dickeya solani IPO 2222]AUC41237.1 Flagellar hook-length control protein FliK [Dickeya solani RNS 08.23.3.1.A]AUH10504.1 flagellar hook-length control protein [Dickeya solani D s0432-1]AUH14438.1 flagellar hook-length control protein [Dickeya solani]AYQ48514.1 Flagellar hook-length control protein [Dickeya solani]
MNLPAMTITTTTDASTTAPQGNSLFALLGKDQLPENFVQLLSQKLSTAQSAKKTVISDQESAELKDALAKGGIEANSDELNAILNALTKGTLTLADVQSGNSLDSLLAKAQKKVSAKDEKTADADALAMQALFAMIPAQTTAQTKAVTEGAASNSSLSDALGELKSGKTSNSVLGSLLGSAKAGDSSSQGNFTLNGSATTDSTAASSLTAAGTSAAAKNTGLQVEDQSKDNPLLTSRKEDSASNPIAASAPADASANSSLQTLSSLFASNATPTQPAAQHVTSQINAPLGTQQWNDALGQQVVMFNRNGQQTAELKLHPEELGSLHIMLKIEDNQAQIHLVSGNSQVRSALESALPHLRSAMAESGINLGQSSVGSDASSWQQSQQQAASNANGNSGNNASSYQQQFGQSEHTTAEVEPLAVPAQLQSMATGINGVDIFA